MDFPEQWIIFQTNPLKDSLMIHSDQKRWLIFIILLVVFISVLHYTTPTMRWQYHLVFMQAYFIPIILAAFMFGVRGGLGTAVLVSIVYFPHIMLQWGGLVENNLMRFLQILLFNAVGYFTGLKAQGERAEKEKYRKTASELEQSLAEQKRQSERISDMEQQLLASDRLATIGELTASLAHEVRNPLGSIRGAVEILRDEVPENLRKSEFFDILIQDTKRLNAVVENYLSFARPKASSITTYNLNEEIGNITLMLGARARKNRIRITRNVSPEPMMIKGDPNHMWQTLMNLILNAMQAMPDGGEIRINAERTKRKGSGQPLIRLRIQDQGQGIDPEKKHELFKPFFTTRSEGTGLGLAIVKRLADENGWQIDMQNLPDQGLEFTLLIPAANY